MSIRKNFISVSASAIFIRFLLIASSKKSLKISSLFSSPSATALACFSLNAFTIGANCSSSMCCNAETTFSARAIFECCGSSGECSSVICIVIASTRANASMTFVSATFGVKDVIDALHIGHGAGFLKSTTLPKPFVAVAVVVISSSSSFSFPSLFGLGDVVVISSSSSSSSSSSPIASSSSFSFSFSSSSSSSSLPPRLFLLFVVFEEEEERRRRCCSQNVPQYSTTQSWQNVCPHVAVTGAL